MLPLRSIFYLSSYFKFNVLIFKSRTRDLNFCHAFFTHCFNVEARHSTAKRNHIGTYDPKCTFNTYFAK